MAATNGSLAQSVEQLAFNQLVVGSNPTRPTIFIRNPPQGGFLRSLSSEKQLSVAESSVSVAAHERAR